MTRLKEYSSVRVQRLLRAPEDYDNWNVNQRPPGIGDVGVLIDILHAPELPDHYLVELSGRDGIPVWLAEFTEEELEPVDDSRSA